MAKGSNWIWWTIGGVSLLGLGVGAYIFFKDRKKKREEAEAENALASQQTTPPPSSSSTSGSSTSGSSLGETPFKNKSEGDAFRNWVNDNYPDYARSIVLDRTGKFNNPTIKKAWAKYGSAYTYSKATTQNTTSTSALTLETIAQYLRDGGLVEDIEIESEKNRVRALAYNGFGFGSNNIYVNLYPDGTLYFEDGNNSRKKSGKFSLAFPNMTIEVEGAKMTGKGGNILNEMAKALYGKSSFGFDNSSDLDQMMYNSKVSFVDSNDANL
jgi:hypothetical protein